MLVDVIIPSLNEEKSIQHVLADLPNVRSVFVVDNGCTDQTPALAKQAGATVLKEPQKGYGSACLRGLKEIEGRSRQGLQEPDIVVFLDADYSDHPDRLPDLIQPIEDGDYDLVLGSRLLGVRESGAMPWQSIFGNRLACFLMNHLFGFQYTDLGPFRAIRYGSLKFLKMTDQNFGWTIEMQIKAVRANLRILEVPVPYRKRIGTSKISGTVSGSFQAGVKILYTIGKYFFQSRNMSAFKQVSNPQDSIFKPASH
ncbi:MAG: glycosyltransferase family 2 protein [Planctomycetota bacterium]